MGSLGALLGLFRRELVLMFPVDQVHGSAVGKKGSRFSGFLMLNSSTFFRNVGHIPTPAGMIFCFAGHTPFLLRFEACNGFVFPCTVAAPVSCH